MDKQGLLKAWGKEQDEWLILSIISTLYSLLISLITKIKFDENTASIMFGVSGGLLSLMGLIAIFVSLNSQHKIQKCRELLWELRSLTREANDAVADKLVGITASIQNKYRDYAIVYQSDDEFIITVTNICQKTIIAICLLWAIYIGFTDISWRQKWYVMIIVYSGIFILLQFHNILGRLTNIGSIGGLPDVASLLDTRNSNDVQPLYLLINDTKIRAYDRLDLNSNFKAPNFMEVEFKFPPVNNFLFYIDKIEGYRVDTKQAEVINDLPFDDIPYFLFEKDGSERLKIVEKWTQHGSYHVHHPWYIIWSDEKRGKEFSHKEIKSRIQDTERINKLQEHGVYLGVQIRFEPDNPIIFIDSNKYYRLKLHIILSDNVNNIIDNSNLYNFTCDIYNGSRPYNQLDYKGTSDELSGSVRIPPNPKI